MFLGVLAASMEAACEAVGSLHLCPANPYLSTEGGFTQLRVFPIVYVSNPPVMSHEAKVKTFMGTCLSLIEMFYHPGRDIERPLNGRAGHTWNLT